MDHLSSSQVGLYLQCPRKYRFRYVDGIPATFKSAAMAFGSSMHSAVAFLAEERKKANGIQLGQVIETFRADWEAQKCDEVRYNGEDESHFLDKGVSLLKLVFDESESWKVKVAEMPFQVPLIDPETGSEIVPVPLEGFIDLVLEPDCVVELKTGVRKWNEEAVSSNLQVTLYSYAYKLLFGKDPELSIKLLLRQRTPRIETFQTTRTRDDVRWALTLVREVFESIKKAAFFPNPGWFCGDCEYADLCKERRPSC